MTTRDPRFARLYLHIFASAACVLPVASYLLSGLGWRPADIGIATASLGVAGTVAAPLWGRLDDRTAWAPRAAMLASGAAAAAAAATLGRLPHLATWAAFALFGAAQGPLDALLTTRVLESGQHGPRLGGLRAFGSLGWVAGLGVAAAALTAWADHPAWVLLAAAVLALTAPRCWGTRTRGPRARGRTALPLRAVLGVLAFTFPSAVVVSGVVQFTAGWAREVLAAGPFLALTPIALCAALEVPAFWWVDRLAGRRSPLFLAVLACPPLALATAALAVLPSSAMMLGVQPLVAMSFALWFVGQSRMLAAAVDPGEQATAQTLGSSLSFGCASLLAGAGGGRLADAAGYGAFFGALGAVALTGTAVGTVALAWRRRTVAGGSSLG